MTGRRGRRGDALAGVEPLADDVAAGVPGLRAKAVAAGVAGRHDRRALRRPGLGRLAFQFTRDLPLITGLARDQLRRAEESVRRPLAGVGKTLDAIDTHPGGADPPARV